MVYQWTIKVHVHADNIPSYQHRELGIETKDNTFVITLEEINLARELEEKEKLQNPQIDILTITPA